MTHSQPLKKVVQEKNKLLSYYSNNKNKFFKNIGYSVVSLFLAMAVIGLNVGYPFQLLVAIPFLIIALNFFIRSLLFKKTTVKKSTTVSFIMHFIKKYSIVIVLLVVVISGLKLFFTLAPMNESPYASLPQTKEALSFAVHNDVIIAATLIDSLDVQTEELLMSGLLSKSTLTDDERRELLNDWNAYLETVAISEQITEINRYFNTISYRHFPEAHASAYAVAYSLYVKKYESFEKIIAALRFNPGVQKILNEYSEVYGSTNSFSDIQSLFYDKDSILKRGLGRLYLSFVDYSVIQKEGDETTSLLVRESKKSYGNLLREATDTALSYSYFVGKTIEGGLFSAWFPVQKNVADTMGKIQISSRKEEFITREQVAAMRPLLMPGDIFIERRNWHVSNAGIPGFWPHAALYLSNLANSNEYFKDVFPYQGYDSFENLIKDKYKNFYATYATLDAHGDAYEVIEGKAPGIILQSLEESGGADFLGVMRARLTKEEKLIAVLQAISNYGKPYDYNFDFETKDAIVCSELVYDAYLPRTGTQGIPFDLEITSGRKMLSPNNIVKKFADENGKDNQILDFVYFFDANEEDGKAYPSTVEAFSDSWKRSKFSWNQYSK